MRVEFNNKTFTTKTAFTAYVKNEMYNSIGFGYYEAGGIQYDFLYKLICRHPCFEWLRGIGHIKAFQLEPNFLNHSNIHMLLVLEDGFKHPISWNKCITSITHTPEERAKVRLISAMRDAISPDTMEFKRNAILKCMFCDSVKNLHTDHSSISFKTISTEFLLESIASGGTIPTKFDSDPITCINRFKTEDIEFAKSWVAYHKSKAVYQILCATCNIKKGG